MSTTLLVTGLLASALAREPPTFPGLMSIDEIASSVGYRATNFEVITEDGYSLWLHRLGNNTGPPVLLQHGIVVGADSWVAGSTRKSLPFMLLENGFDVWLSNQRGTIFNEYSLKYNRTDARFWDFSFDESGYYDIPAFIDTILENRGKKKLFYIGHSLGCGVFLAMNSIRPEYNSKIQAAVLLAPVVYTPLYEEMSPLLRFITQNGFAFNLGALLAGQREIGERTESIITFLKNHCRMKSVGSKLCLTLLGLFVGDDWANLNPKEWDSSVPYYTSGTSAKTLFHTIQVYLSGSFRQFDHGAMMNKAKYNSAVPPDYNFSLVTAPVAIFWGKNDPLISKSTVSKLASQLPNLILLKAVPDPNFNHLDMYFPGRAHKILIPDILKVIKSFL